MKVQGLIVLLAAAVSAVPAGEIPIEGTENISFRCAVNKEHNLVLKERKTPFYLCNSADGDHFLLVATPTDTLEDTFETSMTKAGTIKLREVNAIIAGAHLRPKRSPQWGGYNGGGSSAMAMAASGYVSGGGGNGGNYYNPFGPGYNAGGGFSTAGATSFSAGGGFNQG